MTPIALKSLIFGMRAAYARGENAMAFARANGGETGNSSDSSLIAYDLQSGSYVDYARANPEANVRWGRQLADLIEPHFSPGGSLMEVGVGEATTLARIISQLRPSSSYGFDLSWSRCTAGREWLRENEVAADLFVSDLFSIPLDDDSVDVVYTSHSLEPNGGREIEALRELWRVTRRVLILVEPIYELASPEAQARMRLHGYVTNLYNALTTLGAKVMPPELLPYTPNPLNPSGVIVAIKSSIGRALPNLPPAWRCPLTHTPLNVRDDVYVASEVGLVYPILRGIPLLRPEHAVVASRLG